jgi:hypothetical protein
MTATTRRKATKAKGAQILPVGKPPTFAELFVGALMFSTPSEACAVLKYVEDSDVDEPAITILATVRALALRGTPPSPQLVKDDLMRRGQWDRPVAVWLNKALTSGACDSARGNYGAAVVSQAFRVKVESLGSAMVSAFDKASEDEIAAMVERTATTIRSVGARLAELRGDV